MVEPTEVKIDTAEESKQEPNLHLDDVTGDMVSKGELKKRQKARKNEEAKAKKAEEKAKVEAEKKAAGVGQAKPKLAVEEELDPAKYTENRKTWLQAQRDSGKNPYPHKFSRTHGIKEYREEFEAKITENVFLEEEVVSVTGRIVMIRAAGAKLLFIDIEGDDNKL